MRTMWSLESRCAGLVVAAVMIGVGVVGARTITVDDDEPADFNNIQAAIQDANHGDTVLVRPGTYTGPGNRNIDVLGKAIIVRSADPNDPAVADATVIDCNGLGRAFYIHSGEGSASVIDGLTIIRGNTSNGGAIVCNTTSPTIRRCAFVDNYAYRGGAIDVSGVCGPTITSCRFSHNRAGVGGAVALQETIYHSPRSPLPVAELAGTRTIVIGDCIFTANHASAAGGALNTYDSELVIQGCVFSGNVSGDGGAASLQLSRTTMEHCLVVGNRSNHFGGALFVWFNDLMCINNCTISENVALGYGSAIWMELSAQRTVLLSNSIIADNVNLNSQIHMVSDSSVRIEYCNMVGSPSVISTHGTGAQISWGLGIVKTNPQFAEAGRWVHPDDLNTPTDPKDPNAVWIAGDYHLKSEMGRWDPVSLAWVLDTITSPVVNAGDWQSPYDHEPAPNGNRINMGCYGNTSEASKSSITRVKTLYVDDDGPADYRRIQNAIDVTDHHDTVVVKPGMYTGTGNRDMNFKGRNITVRSIDPNDPAVVAATVINCKGHSLDPHRAFTFSQGENADSVLAGLTIIYGCAEDGGAILITRMTEGGDRDNPEHWVTEAVACTIKNCVFKICRATRFGAAIYVYEGCPTITGCVFSGNSAANTGGAVATNLYMGSVPRLVAGSQGHLTVSNCIFESNTGRWAGAVYLSRNDTASLANCVFYQNVATNATSSVGGIKALLVDAVFLDNCILRANSRNGLLDEQAQLFALNPVFRVDYSCVQGWSGAISGVGNFDADPCFAAPGYVLDPDTPQNADNDYWIPGDYHLKSTAGRWDPVVRRWVFDDVTSPCIDAGDPNAPWGNELWPHGGRVNVGAYGNTFQASLSPYGGGNPVDYDHSGRIDHNDLAIFAGHWLDAPPNPGDINKDNASDLYDFALFASEWSRLFPPGKAHQPTPAVEADGQPFDHLLLSWEGGMYGVWHHVYIGTAEPLDLLATTDQSHYVVLVLQRDTRYLWRVDEENADGYTTGETWSFRTSAAPTQAANPTPANGAANIDAAGTILTWTPGEAADSHDIYLGTTNPPPFVGNREQPAYDPGVLNNKATYYWRIDERNADGVTTGATWSFSTKLR